MERIDPKTMYPLPAVLDLGVLPKGNKPKSNLYRLQRHAREGKLKVQNISSILQPRYLVRGRDLIKYLNKYYEQE